MKKIFLLKLLLLSASFNFAQMPDSDVWLFGLKRNKSGATVISDSINITRRKGYDNQPTFSPNGKKIYYVSVREDKQADIYVYDISHKKTLRLTQSVESEYSPQFTPDDKHLSVVMVERDSAQRIHVLDAENGLSVTTINEDSVGYYRYLNKDTVIYYKLTEPHSLRMHVLQSGEDKWICNQPTRGFKTIHRSKLLYAVKDSNRVDFFIYDFNLQKAKLFCSYPSTSEDAYWHPTLGLMKSEEAKILRYVPNKNSWEVYLDLSSYGIKKITRFAFDDSDKKLLVVNNL